MAIHFKPISNLSNLIFLGLFLLVVQLQNSAVDAGDVNLGHRHVRALNSTICEGNRDNLCLALKCGATGCDQESKVNNIDPPIGSPYCECIGAIDEDAAKTCTPVDRSETAADPDPKDLNAITPGICKTTCDKVSATSDTTPKTTYAALVCPDGEDSSTLSCACVPQSTAASGGPAEEEKVDELIETAKAVISGLVNAIVTFVQDLVQAVVDLVTSLAKLPLGDILSGLVGSLKGIVGDIGGAKDSK